MWWLSNVTLVSYVKQISMSAIAMVCAMKTLDSVTAFDVSSIREMSLMCEH
jgi:hypothetical protein